MQKLADINFFESLDTPIMNSESHRPETYNDNDWRKVAEDTDSDVHNFAQAVSDMLKYGRKLWRDREYFDHYRNQMLEKLENGSIWCQAMRYIQTWPDHIKEVNNEK